jgi:Cd2+/Zn2+-exporting ATPase
VEKSGLSEYTEHSGYGVSVKREGKTILAGNRKLMDKFGISMNNEQLTINNEEGTISNEQLAMSNEKRVGTEVWVACDGVFAGRIVISDEVKPDSCVALAALKERGVSRTVMLTGDNPQIARAIAEELGVDEVYGGLLPQEKVEKLEALNAQKSPKKKLAFVGDGINDAPVLAMADIGVAMGALGSDAAIEAADVVLMTDEPAKLAEVIDIARFTKRVVWQNIVFALGVKAVFLALGAFGVANMWEAVFADVGVALLAILNAMRIIHT